MLQNNNSSQDSILSIENLTVSFDGYKVVDGLSLSVDEKELRGITFFQYLTLIYDHETACYIKDAFGYDSEFVDLNAESAISMFEDDLFGDNHYYVLKNGLSQLIDKMKNAILMSSTIVKTGTKIKEITDTHVVTQKGDTFFFDHLVCAIPPSSLKHFDYFKELPQIDSVKPIPLLRIYAKYPTKDLWFKNIKRTTTDNYIRQIIPIDYESGLIMISYTDGKYARFWKEKNKASMVKELKYYIHQTFDVDMATPVYLKKCYWDLGTAYWKPNEKSHDIARKMIQPMDCPLYICGENYSTNQGWMEGALETAEIVLNKLSLK